MTANNGQHNDNNNSNDNDEDEDKDEDEDEDEDEDDVIILSKVLTSFCPFIVCLAVCLSSVSCCLPQTNSQQSLTNAMRPF
ncbi:hypothetical protein ACLKA6_006711 [Drosophila palustris]